MSLEVQGRWPARFEPLRAAFAASFERGEELGARFAVAIDGEVVVDMMAGFADRDRTQPFGPDTLTPVFSTTKAMAALMVARLIDSHDLDYDQPLAELWPEFAAAGKAAISIGGALSHQGGLCGLPEPMPASAWFDKPLIAARVAAMAPLWPPGSASGYHPVTFGYLAEEVFRRLDGRTIGAALAEDLAGPFGLDLWIGLPDSEHGRCAQMRKPPAMPDLGPASEPRRLAFRTPWASPGGVSQAEWRRAAIASVTGHATAPALARMMAVLACDGTLDGRRFLSSRAVAAVSAERVRGPDLVLPFTLSWAAGLLRNTDAGIYGPSPRALGHSGWGGSCAFADPGRRLSGAYVMNRQSSALIGDQRAVRLIRAAYACL